MCIKTYVSKVLKGTLWLTLACTVKWLDIQCLNKSDQTVCIDQENSLRLGPGGLGANPAVHRHRQFGQDAAGLYKVMSAVWSVVGAAEDGSGAGMLEHFA